MAAFARLLTAVTTSVVLAAAALTVPAAAVAEEPPPQADSGTSTAAAALPELRFDDPSIDWTRLLVDGDDVERVTAGSGAAAGTVGDAFNTFGGFGSVSCNNTSNLLLDYKEENPEAYWRIMNLLFDEETGAGLHHIKVELGADNNTSSGSEPATKRSADEPANVLRGAGFHFIADALSINPDIEVEALRWGEPSWTNGDTDLRYQWYKETIDAAYDTYGIEFTYLSPSQNEVHNSYIGAELSWTVAFAERLERDASDADARYDYGDIKIVALDSYRNGEAVAQAILDSPAALEQVDAIGIHYTIGGGPKLTRLNKEFGMEVLYSEGVAPMIDPEYRVEGQPEFGGLGGTVGAVDIADRFINAYRWSGSGADPAHMTSFLFQPAVSALYEGSQYSPKDLIRASDPWSGYYEGGVGIALVRHFTQFIDEGWEYIEGASGGDGAFADGGTAVNSSTRTVLTLRTPAAVEGAVEWSQVHANNTAQTRSYEVAVADLGETGRQLAVWQTEGPDAGDAVDANHFQNIGGVSPIRTETVNGEEYEVYRVQVQPYSILTLSTLTAGLHGGTASYESGEYASLDTDTVLPLPYSDDFEYADYPAAEVNGASLSYLERRGGSPRYTADQNGAFEVAATGDPAHGNAIVQKIHAGNRGYTWNVWGDGSQRNVSTAPPATVLGDHSWTDYTASIAFRHDTVVRDASLPNYVGLGVRQTHVTGDDLATYTARVAADGTWQLRKLGSVVASGAVPNWNVNTWHTLSVQARETTITVAVDGATLTTWTDASANPVLSGRVALVSGYYNSAIDDLRVDPIEGYAWSSTKVDDSSPATATAALSYTGARFNQVGYAHLNRTTHSLPTGASFRLDFDGSGLNLNGASAASTLSVRVDGGPAYPVTTGATGDRQTSYWLRGLAEDTRHTLEATVTSGTFTLDGVDVLTGGTPLDAEPATTPVAVVTPPARQAVVIGSEPSLPPTVRAVAQSGGEIDAPVTWTIDRAALATPYATATVAGSFVNNPSLTVSAVVEVVPAELEYFIDAAAFAGSNVGNLGYASPAWTAIEALDEIELRNGAPDQVYSAASGWGLRTPIDTGAQRVAAKSVVAGPYSKGTTTGWYAAGAGAGIDYRVQLPAGQYEVTFGYHEWWGQTRNIQPVVTSGGVSVNGPVAALTSSAVDRTSTVRVTVAQDGAVDLSSKLASGSQLPVLSWIGIADVTPEPELEASASASVRCIAGKAVVTVQLRNDGAAPLDVRIVSVDGTRSFAAVAPGANAAAAFTTRLVSVPERAAEVTLSATIDGRVVNRTLSATSPATSCG